MVRLFPKLCTNAQSSNTKNSILFRLKRVERSSPKSYAFVGTVRIQRTVSETRSELWNQYQKEVTSIITFPMNACSESVPFAEIDDTTRLDTKFRLTDSRWHTYKLNTCNQNTGTVFHRLLTTFFFQKAWVT